ncbi:GAF domain-containing protein [Methylopila sp. M107]|uniref:GAF domain-containing protein n=1 Tax=Methylopila sp. M107 TaxID=1101190 RepID=UPI00035D9AA8|nr:GAF domain-containing protein [Methylopila sp. M107]
MKSFLRAVEVWRPEGLAGPLVFDDGLYGEDLADFREASLGMRFALDEGLPGKAWAQRRPIVLKGFRGSYFKRVEAAEAAGLTCGIALPIFRGDALQAVTVFFCGDDEENVGVIEVWKHDPERSPGIKFVDGHFGIAEALEWEARHITFMPGSGLPGMVWLRNRPVFVADLGNAARFIRTDDARRVGLNKGLGIPCPGDGANAWVMLFLSAFGTPIAQRQEIWSVGEGGETLAFRTGDCVRDPDLPKSLAGAVIGRGEGAIGQALTTGAPKIAASLAADATPVATSAAAAGLAAMVALPIYDDDEVSSVVSFYF